MMADYPKANDTYIFSKDIKPSILLSGKLGSLPLNSFSLHKGRLNHNYWLFSKLTCYRIHPQIRNETADLHVADIGAGIGYVALPNLYLPVDEAMASTRFPINT